MRFFNSLTKKALACLLIAVTLFSIPVFSSLAGQEVLPGLAVSAEAADASVVRTKATATTRLMTLVNKLNGKYFTTTGKAVYSNKNNSCYNANVIGASWLQKAMSMVPSSAALMPM